MVLNFNQNMYVLSSCMHLHHVQALHQRDRKGVGYLRLRVTDGCELPYKNSLKAQDILGN